MIDQPLPEDAEIREAHPMKTGHHEIYAEAMRLVGAKHSKGELVALVNWLLWRIWEQNEEAKHDGWERDLNT